MLCTNWMQDKNCFGSVKNVAYSPQFIIPIYVFHWFITECNIIVSIRRRHRIQFRIWWLVWVYYDFNLRTWREISFTPYHVLCLLLKDIPQHFHTFSVVVCKGVDFTIRNRHHRFKFEVCKSLIHLFARQLGPRSIKIYPLTLVLALYVLSYTCSRWSRNRLSLVHDKTHDSLVAASNGSVLYFICEYQLTRSLVEWLSFKAGISVTHKSRFWKLSLLVVPVWPI